MNNLFSRRLVISLLVGLYTALLAGCVVVDGGYGYGYGDGVGGDVGLDYYEPFGMNYGGWSPGYRVGPSRGEGQRGSGQSSQHSYRSAPASHSAPSIPSRSGGSRSGGSRSR
jgi:hypothetical protein